MLRTRKCPEGENIPTSISLANRQCLTFGRDPRSDIVLKWDGVSRAHAWLDEVTTATPAGHTGWELVCNGSGNGSFINGVRQSRALLRDGDFVGFGICMSPLADVEHLCARINDALP
jgi:pSer/pThr/pTyr-binding forkhead associated (FHA) protein